jgi:hypothetical protein
MHHVGVTYVFVLGRTSRPCVFRWNFPGRSVRTAFSSGRKGQRLRIESDASLTDPRLITTTAPSIPAFGDRFRSGSISPENDLSFLSFRCCSPIFNNPILARGERATILVEPRSSKYASAHDPRRTFGTRWLKRINPTMLSHLKRRNTLKTIHFENDHNTPRRKKAQDTASNLGRQQVGNTVITGTVTPQTA